MKPSTRLWLASLYLFIMGTISIAYTIAEILLGLMYESLLVISDAIHGFMDAAIAYIAGFGLYYASRRGRSFPWEVYRLESLLALLTALAVLSMYTYFLTTSLRIDISPTPLWMTTLLAAGGVLTYFMYLWQRYNYRVLKLEILKADSVHAKVDAILSTVSAISVIVSNYFNFTLIEIFAIFLIYGYAAIEFIKLSKEALHGVLGTEYRDPVLRGQIEKTLGDLGRPVVVKIRRAGSFLVVYSLVAVNSDMTVGKLHILRSKAIKSITRLHPLIVHVDIKVVPLKKRRSGKL
ncbi:MAG: cation transporter [Pyrobaculum sp.]